MGRLFDAVAALCGLKDRVSFEGEAAMQLEFAVDPGEDGRVSSADHVTRCAGRRRIGGRCWTRYCGIWRRAAPRARSRGGFTTAWRNWPCSGPAAWELPRVVLTGGCFQNRLLTRRVRAAVGVGIRSVHSAACSSRRRRNRLGTGLGCGIAGGSVKHVSGYSGKSPRNLAGRRIGVPMGKVEFGGISKDICLVYLPEVVVGDYVLVHVGFAISKIDEAEAQEIFSYIDQIGEFSELGGFV